MQILLHHLKNLTNKDLFLQEYKNVVLSVILYFNTFTISESISSKAKRHQKLQEQKTNLYLNIQKQSDVNYVLLNGISILDIPLHNLRTENHVSSKIYIYSRRR